VALAQAADEGTIDLQHRVTVRPNQRAGGSGILNELETPVELSLADHAHLMIAISDNTASNVLIDAVGPEAIAATASGIGLKGTALQRRFLGRLPDPGTPENLTTAEDLTTLLVGIATGTAASPERCAWMRDRLAGQHYLNRLPRFLPDGVTFAGKSGSLEGFDHDSGLFSGPGGTLAVAVLHRNVRDPYAADVVIGTIGAAAVADAGLAEAAG
jgi:beta-lactamase class A